MAPRVRGRSRLTTRRGYGKVAFSDPTVQFFFISVGRSGGGPLSFPKALSKKIVEHKSSAILR